MHYNERVHGTHITAQCGLRSFYTQRERERVQREHERDF